MRFAGILVLAALGSASCNESSLPQGHHLSKISFPLFENLEENCLKLLEQRDQAGRPESELSDEVRWASSLEEAFERGAREDKLVLVASFVRENGDPDCDV